MFGKRLSVMAALASAALASLAIAVVGGVVMARSVSASSTSSPVIGHVYVDDNPAGPNTIAAFDEHRDGTLTSIGAFATGGIGSGGGLHSQGSLQVSSDGRYLLAADGGSYDIAVLRIAPDGSLTAVDRASSNGALPNSIAVHDSLVYVSNYGDGMTLPNYTGFMLSATGQLSPIMGSTIPLTHINANPGEVFFNSTGTRLIGIEVGTISQTQPGAFAGAIDSYTVMPNGTLSPDHQVLPLVPGPFGSEFRPTNPNQLFVTNAHGGPGNGAVTAYEDGPHGTLTPIGGSAVPDTQTAPCWLSLSADGRFAYAVNTGSGSISAYAIAANGSLRYVGSTALNNPHNTLAALELRTDLTGRYAFDVDAGDNAVISLATDRTGAITEQSTISLPAGSSPAGIAVN